MFKLVLGDYKRQVWSALKNVYNVGDWFLFVYLGIEPPIIFSLNAYQTYVYYGAFLPMLLSLLLSRMYPNRISKTLLLCPMTLEERKNYLVMGFKIKLMIPLAMFLVCNLPFLLTGKLMVWYCIVTVVFLFMFGVSVNIYCDPTVHAPGAFEREYDLPGYYPIWQVAASLVGIFEMAILVNMQITQQNFWEDKLALGIAMFLFLAELGICIKMIRTYYKPIMEQAVYYASSYGKEKKDEVNR